MGSPRRPGFRAEAAEAGRGAPAGRRDRPHEEPDRRGRRRLPGDAMPGIDRGDGVVTTEAAGRGRIQSRRPGALLRRSERSTRSTRSAALFRVDFRDQMAGYTTPTITRIAITAISRTAQRSTKTRPVSAVVPATEAFTERSQPRPTRSIPCNPGKGRARREPVHTSMPGAARDVTTPVCRAVVYATVALPRGVDLTGSPGEGQPGLRRGARRRRDRGRLRRRASAGCTSPSGPASGARLSWSSGARPTS